MAERLIVFDFDGTLVDSQASFDVAVAEFSSARNLPHDIKKMAVGYVDPLKYDLGWGVPLEQQPQLHKELYHYYYTQMMEHSRFMPPFFPKAEEVLKEVAQSYDLGIITARDRTSLDLILKHHHIDHYFPHYRSLCCAQERGYAIKPAPDSLQCLLRDTKHDPDDVIVVGDTTSDILMANNAGVKSAAALWGAHSQERLETAKPTIMVEILEDLPIAINDLFNQ